MIKLFKANQSEQTIAQLQQLCRDLDAKLTETELRLTESDKEVVRLREALGEMVFDDKDEWECYSIAKAALGVE